jgi:hypothetical protein
MLAIRSEAYPEQWVLYFVASMSAVHHYYRDGVSGANSSPACLPGKMFETTSARWSSARSTKRAAMLLLFDAGFTTSGSDMNLIVDNRSARSTSECTRYGHFHRRRAFMPSFRRLRKSCKVNSIAQVGWQGDFSRRSCLVRCSARRIPTGKGVK